MRALHLVSLTVALSASIAAAAEPKVTVKLTSSIPNQGIEVGQVVTLTTSIVGLPSRPPLGINTQQPIDYVYRARRIWPCQELPFVIEKTDRKEIRFTAPKAGKYKFEVAAAYDRPGPASSIPLGTATTEEELVRPEPGFSSNWTSSYSPPSPSNVGTVVNATASLTSPAAARYIFTFDCGAVCSPPRIVRDGTQTAWNWSFTLMQPRQQHPLWITIDKIRTSDCTWLQRGVDHDFYTITR